MFDKLRKFILVAGINWFLALGGFLFVIDGTATIKTQQFWGKIYLAGSSAVVVGILFILLGLWLIGFNICIITKKKS